MSITKKIRFEVFKRDKFTCQYCGQQAPDVTLQVDHIEPKSAGGSDDILNLVTSCFDCNQGKKHRRLSDNDAIKKRKKQLDDLQERREQLEMLMEWHKSLIDLEGQVVTEIADLWLELTGGWTPNDAGMADLKKWSKKFGLNELIEAMRISTDQYLEFDEDIVNSDTSKPNDQPVATKDTAQKAWNYIPRICTIRKLSQGDPHLQRLYYIRGILRNRLNYLSEHQAIEVMRDAISAGIDINDIEAEAKITTSWTAFRNCLENWAKDSPKG